MYNLIAANIVVTMIRIFDSITDSRIDTSTDIHIMNIQPLQVQSPALGRSKRLMCLAVFFLIASLSACSNVPDTVFEEFVVNNSNGLQQFSYKAVLDVPAKTRNSRYAAQNPRKAKTRNKIETQALAALDAQLQLNNYCPNGYFIMDKFINRTQVEIRGECKSSAP